MSIPQDLNDRAAAILSGFTAVATSVKDWQATTPVPEWEAQDIVQHLATWFPAVVRAAGVEMDLSKDPKADPAAAWQEFSDAAYAVIREEAETDIPEGAGPPGVKTIGQLATAFFLPDVFMHTWDLARSQGQDVQLDADYAAKNREGLASLGDALRDGKQFGEAHPVDDDASEGEKLMAFVGRDPNFGLQR